MRSTTEVKLMENNWSNLGAWLILTGCLSALLFYGLSFFFSKPTVETITVNSSSNVINDNRIHDAKFQQRKQRAN